MSVSARGSVFSRRPGLRWAVPAAVVIAAAGGVVATQAASASPDLPPRSAQQLLADVAGASATPVSGTVSEHADLGLPSLPTGSSGSGSSTSAMSMLTGDHELRVWSDGPDKARVAVTGTLGESDVVRNGNDTWVWSSDDRTAVHSTRTNGSGAGAAPSAASATPQQAAAQVLAAVGPTTTVSTSAAVSVAGRDAYELVLEPKDASLVGSVRIAVDASTHVPLRVQVFARGASAPAFSVGFTSVSYAKPAASTFDFTPPAGAKVTQENGASAPKTHESTGAAAPTVVGTGWTSVVVAHLDATELSGAAGSGASGKAGASTGSGDAASVLASLPKVSGSWGSGRLLTSALVSVLLTDVGRVLAGAVAPAQLYQVAGQSTAK